MRFWLISVEILPLEKDFCPSHHRCIVDFVDIVCDLLSVGFKIENHDVVLIIFIQFLLMVFLTSTIILLNMIINFCYFEQTVVQRLLKLFSLTNGKESCCAFLVCQGLFWNVWLGTGRNFIETTKCLRTVWILHILDGVHGSRWVTWIRRKICLCSHLAIGSFRPWPQVDMRIYLRWVQFTSLALDCLSPHRRCIELFMLICHNLNCCFRIVHFI